MIVSLYFDGLCEPGPDGPVATYGWIVRDLPGRGAPPDMGSGQIVIERPTGDVAAYCALGKALLFLAKNAKGSIGPRDLLMIAGESEPVIRQLHGDWACREKQLQPLLGRCRALLTGLGCEWEVTWVSREHNTAADQLCRAAYVGITGRPAPVRVVSKSTPQGAKR